MNRENMERFVSDILSFMYAQNTIAFRGVYLLVLAKNG